LCDLACDGLVAVYIIVALDTAAVIDTTFVPLQQLISVPHSKKKFLVKNKKQSAASWKLSSFFIVSIVYRDFHVN